MPEVRGGAERSNPTSKEWRLRFAGVAVKRYPMPKLREAEVRR